MKLLWIFSTMFISLFATVIFAQVPTQDGKIIWERNITFSTAKKTHIESQIQKALTLADQILDAEIKQGTLSIPYKEQILNLKTLLKGLFQLRITSTGLCSASYVEAFTRPDTEPYVIYLCGNGSRAIFNTRINMAHILIHEATHLTITKPLVHDRDVEDSTESNVLAILEDVRTSVKGFDWLDIELPSCIYNELPRVAFLIEADKVISLDSIAHSTQKWKEMSDEDWKIIIQEWKEQ